MLVAENERMERRFATQRNTALTLLVTASIVMAVSLSAWCWMPRNGSPHYEKLLAVTILLMGAEIVLGTSVAIPCPHWSISESQSLVHGETIVKMNEKSYKTIIVGYANTIRDNMKEYARKKSLLMWMFWTMTIWACLAIFLVGYISLAL